MPFKETCVNRHARDRKSKKEIKEFEEKNLISESEEDEDEETKD